MMFRNILIILSVTGILPWTQASPVTLQIENATGTSSNYLQGTFCPGKVRLLCCGIGLPFLEWRYNEGVGVAVHFADDSVTSPTAVSGNPAFETVQLQEIRQDQTVANYTSTLVVDLVGLRDRGVYEIACGDAVDNDAVPVNVTIGLTDPPAPTITTVQATYQNGQLVALEVSWMKVVTMCPLSIKYAVSLNDDAPYTLAHSTCGDICSFSPSNFSDGKNIITVGAFSVLTNNVIRSTFPTAIDISGGVYIKPSISRVGFSPVGLCQHTNGDVENCTVRYSTSDIFQETINTLIVPVNLSFPLPSVAFCVRYFFEFSVVLEDRLVIVERLVFTLETNPPPGAGEIVLIILFVLTLILSVIPTVLLFYFTVRPNKMLISKHLLFIEVPLMIITTLISLLFFMSWIGIVADGVCRVNWLAARVSLLVICLLFLNAGLVIRIIIISCTRCAIPTKVISTEVKTMDKSTEIIEILLENAKSADMTPPERQEKSLSDFGKDVETFFTALGKPIDNFAKNKPKLTDPRGDLNKPVTSVSKLATGNFRNIEQPSPQLSVHGQLPTIKPLKKWISIDREVPCSKYRPGDWIAQPPAYRDVAIQVKGRTESPLRKLPPRLYNSPTTEGSGESHDRTVPDQLHFGIDEIMPSSQLISDIEVQDSFIRVTGRTSLFSILTDKSIPNVVGKKSFTIHTRKDTKVEEVTRLEEGTSSTQIEEGKTVKEISHDKDSLEVGGDQHRENAQLQIETAL